MVQIALAQKGTHPGLFQIRFQYIWAHFDLKNPVFVPFMANMTLFAAKSDIPLQASSATTC